MSNPTPENARRVGGSVQRLVRRPPTATREAVQASLDWVDACRTLGWRGDDLDSLESLWWQYHDSEGKRKTPNEKGQR